jgi:hypothetical protein
MESLQSVAVGVVLGLVVIAVLSKFPGEPFDFATGSKPTPSSLPNDASGALEPPAKTEEVRVATAKAEIERAAQQVRVERLQMLLGLEKEKVHELIEQAKEEAIKQQLSPAASDRREVGTTGRLAWVDRSFLVLAMALLACVMWWDYGINMLQVLAYLFPREADTLGKVAAVPLHVVEQLQPYLWSGSD